MSEHPNESTGAVEETDVDNGETASWVKSGLNYEAIREEMESKWNLSDQAVTEDLEKVEKVISLLAARRIALTVEPEDMERMSTVLEPDLEGDIEFEEVPEGLPPSIPVAAVMESGHTDDLVIEMADELALDAWTPETERLYDDVLYLFESGDLDGALVSLERLLLLGGRTPEVQEFISLNEAKLLKLYERSIGSFTGAPQRERRGEAMPMSFLQRPSVATVFNSVNGETTVEQLVEAAGMPPLEVCAVLNQLRRSRLISCS